MLTVSACAAAALSSKGPAIYRGMGSIGIAGVARSVWCVAPEKGEDSGAYVMASTKVNIAASPPSQRYRIEGVGHPDRRVPARRVAGRIVAHGGRHSRRRSRGSREARERDRRTAIANHK